MTHFGNLRRRILRALPTYQYPQQYFVLKSPDILVQAGVTPNEVNYVQNGFGAPYAGSYGWAWLVPLLGMGVKAGQGIQAQHAAQDLAAMTAEAQLAANAQAANQAAAAETAFQKRMPLYGLILSGTLILGIVAIFKFRGS